MSKAKAKYVGVAEYVNGVPARDLTEEEWDALPKEKQTIALTSGLYELAEEKKASKKEGD